jgi:hypothetical protein
MSYHLNADHKHCLQVELALAVLEQVFEARAQKIHNHYMKVFAVPLGCVCAHIVQTGYARYTFIRVWQLLFPLSLWMSLLSQNSMTCF